MESALVRKKTSNKSIIEEIFQRERHVSLLLFKDTCDQSVLPLLESLCGARGLKTIKFGTDYRQSLSLCEKGAFLWFKDFLVGFLKVSHDDYNVFFTDLYALCKLAKMKNVTLIIDLQKDIINSNALYAFEYIASTILDVSPKNNRGQYEFSVVAKKSGKIEEELAIVNTSDCIFKKQTVNKLAAEKSTSNAVPTSSFNLNISSQEAKDKASVVLPHTRAQNDQIYRHQILADDYDDEDPDEDLEF